MKSFEGGIIMVFDEKYWMPRIICLWNSLSAIFVTHKVPSKRNQRLAVELESSLNQSKAIDSSK